MRLGIDTIPNLTLRTESKKLAPHATRFIGNGQLTDMIEQHQVVVNAAPLTDLPRRFDIDFRDNAMVFLHHHTFYS